MCASCLKKGQRAVISSVDVTHRAAPRLIEMGFTPGSELEMLGTSPFGDPMMLRLRGYTVAVRKKDLSAISLEGVRHA